MRVFTRLLLFIVFEYFLGAISINAQVDTTLRVADTVKASNVFITADTVISDVDATKILAGTDTIPKKKVRGHSPRGATLRSAILPGWGQVYNKKLWKIPIVYAALGGTAYYFFDNLKWYNRLKYAYPIAYAIQQAKNPGDTIGSPAYNKIYERLKGPFFENTGVYPEALRSARDQYRKDVDYAALYFMIAWVLNIIDATVDAHLNHFDISPNLSFNIVPGYSEMARTSGVSVVLKLK